MKDMGEASYVIDIEIHRDELNNIKIVSEGLHWKSFGEIQNEGQCTFSSTYY